MAKKYKIERRKLIEYYILTVSAMCHLNVVMQDLIKGSEFILTDQDILENVGNIDGRLLIDKDGKSPLGDISYEQIEIVYS
jgi:hypothetical protein